VLFSKGPRSSQCTSRKGKGKWLNRGALAARAPVLVVTSATSAGKILQIVYSSVR